MKTSLTIALFLFVLASCKKESSPASNDQYLVKVKKGLTDSLPASTYQNLDFDRLVLNRVDSIGLYAVRIPFKAKSVAEDFVIVKTNREGEVKRGQIIHLEVAVSDTGRGNLRPKSISGSIRIHSLTGTEEVNSPIRNGYITAFHSQLAQRTSVELAPDRLPEVVITGIRYLDGGFSFSMWCMVESFFMDYGGGGGGSWGGYYGSLDGSDPWSGGGGGPTGGGSPSGGGSPNTPTILIDYENQDENPAIDIQKYIDCFNAVPDAGATCSVEIFSDIPLDNDPNAFYDFSTGSPGHTFIKISKDNGSQHVTQNIGFYPKPGYKAITFLPTLGKLVNNAGHEFNASLSMSITPGQLSTVLNQLLQQPNQSYDLADYNCTDWALAIFNSVRATPLEIPRFPIIGMYSASNASTPQGLYKKLQQMKAGNDPEQGNITIGIVKGYAGGSNGPCN